MSNSQSALVRSNLGRNNALSVAGTIAPRVISSLVKTAVESAIKAYNGSGGGGIPVQSVNDWAAPQQTRLTVARKRRRRKTKSAGISAGSAISRPISVPNVRRILKGVYNVGSDNTGISVLYWNVAVGQPTNLTGAPLFGAVTIGTVNTNFVNCYNFVKLNKVTVRFIPSVSTTSSTAFQYAMGYTKKNKVSPPTGFTEYIDYTQFVYGGNEGNAVTFVPHNAHGGVLPVNPQNSDDFNEETAGVFTAYFKILPAQSFQFGFLYVEADATLMDA